MKLFLIALQAIKVGSFLFSTVEKLVYTKEELIEIPPVSEFDSSPFTKQEFDYINHTYEAYSKKKSQQWTIDDLVDFLNHKLGRHKSKTDYIRVWIGSVNRTKLPDGKTVSRG